MFIEKVADDFVALLLSEGIGFGRDGARPPFGGKIVKGVLLDLAFSSGVAEKCAQRRLNRVLSRFDGELLFVDQAMLLTP